MARRNRMSFKQNKRNFRKNTGVHPKNNAPTPMRGGIRL